MPKVSVWTVRLSLLYLVAGFTLGALMLSSKGFLFWPVVWRYLPAHVELLIVGWMIQFALGVAYWIMPRFRGGVRGRPRIAWAALVLLNAGIAASLTGLLIPSVPSLLAGRVLEAAGAILFMGNLWRRVKPFETSSR